MKRLKSLFTVLGILVICLTLLTAEAYAAETVGAPVAVAVRIEGTPPEQAEEYAIVLSADDESFPMPEGSVDGSYTLKITGEGDAVLPAASYDRAGVYTYTITQTAGADETCDYDDTVYKLTVFVTNKEGGGLETASVLYSDDMTEKLSGAKFVNTYPVLIDVTVKKIWRDSDGVIPEKAEVALLRNGEEYDSAALSEENGWTYTWRRLLEADDWTVEEINVPEGYTVSYDKDGNTVIITNSEIEGDLPPQTGDGSNAALYTWLFAGGFAGLTGVAAFELIRKKRKNE